jgi:hypothetical protein
LELRYLGKQQEKIPEAKTGALDSEKIEKAMEERAEYEAGKLAESILYEQQQADVRATGPLSSSSNNGVSSGKVPRRSLWP